MPRAIRITSASGALTVNVTGPAGNTPTVYADSQFSATTSLPATIGDGATSTLWLKSPGAYTLSVKTSSGTEIAGDNNQTRTVDLETPDTIAALSYDTRFTHRIEGDSGRGSDTGDTNAAYRGSVSFPVSTGTDDTSALNAILAAASGKLVTGVPGQVYLTSAPLVIPSNVVLDMTGCTVRLIVGSNTNIVQNAAVGTVRRVLDAVTTSASTTLTSATAAFTSGDVGKAITIQGAGASGVPLTTTIASVTNGTTAVLTAAAGTSVTGQYAAIGSRDSGIKVIGGTWDRQNNSSPTDQTLAHLLRFRHVDGLTVAPDDLLSSAVGSKYGVSIADCTDFDVPTAHSTKHYSDVLHISGPCSNFRIGVVTADLVGDDVISFTARDSTTVITDTAGDITDFTVTAGHKKADLGGGLTSGVLKLVAGKTTDGSASYSVKRFTAGTFTGPNTNEAVAYIGDTTGGNLAGRVDVVRSLGGSGGTFDAVYLGGGTTIDLDFGTVECATDDRGPVRVAGGATGVLAGTLRVRRPIIPSGHTVTSIGCVTIDGQLTRVQVDAGTHKGGSGGSIVHVTNGLTPHASAGRVQIGRAHLEVATGGSGAGLVRAEDSASTVSLIEISDADVLNANYALGMLATTTTVAASNVHAEGASLSSWIRVKSGGVVTLKGAAGLDTALTTDTYTVDAGGTLYLAARNGNALVTDPDLLSTGEETIDRRMVSNTGLGGTSGRLWLTYFTARKTETINNVRTLQGSQAAATVTLCRIGIYSVAANGDLALVASTANDATLWTGTFSATTKALSGGAFSKVAGQRYAIGFLSVATTAPKWVGVAPALGTEDGQAPRLNGNVDAQSDLPSTVASASVANSGGTSLYAALTP